MTNTGCTGRGKRGHEFHGSANGFLDQTFSSLAAPVSPALALEK